MTRKADLIAAREANSFRDFINLRAKYSDNYILIYEGTRCSFAYQPWFLNVNANYAKSSVCLHVNGRRHALKLHASISNNEFQISNASTTW